MKTDPNEIGATTIKTKAVGQTGAMTDQGTRTGIQVIVVTGGGTMGTTGVDIDETVGRDPDHRGGRDPGIGTMEGGDGLGRE